MKIRNYNRLYEIRNKGRVIALFNRDEYTAFRRGLSRIVVRKGHTGEGGTAMKGHWGFNHIWCRSMSKETDWKTSRTTVNWKELAKEATTEAQKAPNKLEDSSGIRLLDGGVSEETVNKAMDHIITAARKNGATNDWETGMATGIIMQKGGANQRTGSETTIRYGDSTVTTRMIRKACADNKMTPRQLARAMGDEIMSMMMALGDERLEGNMAKRYRRDYPDATLEERLWASDFQTYNPQCPERVRQWLVNDYRDRFER